tara:strand:+ start:19717 stop:19827 length:111 start_codon:yes stop_codon:yes gene_type:complete
MKRLNVPAIQATEMLDTEYLIAVGALPDPMLENDMD